MKTEKFSKEGDKKSRLFEKLTPTVDGNISGYKEALDFALSNPDNIEISNIAVTGPYGSGKSSVIESYKQHSDLKFLHIALSHYDGTDDLETKNLEGKIVNQLLHQIDYKKIPQTIFMVKDNISRWKIFGYAITIVSTLGFIYGILKLDNLNKYFVRISEHNQFWKAIFENNGLFYFWWSMTIGLALFLGYKLIKLQFDKRVMKSLKIGESQIEILHEEESYFDKFMNDVIYLFVNSGSDVIVFEDLDRFKDSTIYEKLKEINFLVNKRISMNAKGTTKSKISFLYLIRDDMFKSKDRTKFFDFVIPIIPVMDSSNSYEMFLKIFKNTNIENDFEESTLKKLSLYIDDYRLLKNIVNEYRIYKKRLVENPSENQKIELDKTKLLSIVIYKNIFPKDFTLLRHGESYLNQIFLKKQEIINTEINRISSQIEQITKEIVDSEYEKSSSIDELDSVFIPNSALEKIEVGNQTEMEFLNRIEFIKEIKKMITRSFILDGIIGVNLKTFVQILIR